MTAIAHKTIRCKVIESYFRHVGRSYGTELTTLFILLAVIAVVGIASGW